MLHTTDAHMLGLSETKTVNRITISMPRTVSGKSSLFTLDDLE